MTEKFRRTSVFRGPVKFGYDADTASRDITIYGATASSSWLFDMSLDKLILEGTDLELNDEDKLIFGDSDDFVIDWSTADGLQFLPAAAGNDITFGTSSLYADADWDMGNMDIDIYATTGYGVDINRNLTSGSTNSAVVYIKQDNASDDQAALKIDQDATGYLCADFNGFVDLGYTLSEPSSSTIDIGAVRVFKDSTNWYFAVHTTGGVYKFMAFDLTTGGLS